MNATLSDNPAERAMITTLRVWFLWPLACFVFAVAASPFGTQIRIANSWSQWLFFMLLIVFSLVPLWFLGSAAVTSVRSMTQKHRRFQGIIALLMTCLTCLVVLPLGAIMVLLMLDEA